jgi:tetratricopeptide (TPR) repeat protein
MAVAQLHLLLATGQFLAAYREAERLALDPSLDPLVRAKVCIIGVRAALGLRELYAGAKMAEKAIEAAELGSDWEDIGNARLCAATLYGELGDTALALRFFQLFFDYLDRYPALQSKTALAYYNRARIRTNRKEYDEALADLKFAAEDFARLGYKIGVLASLDNSAWALLRTGRVDEAGPLLAQAESLLPGVESAEHQVGHMVIQAFFFHKSGMPERATALCEEVFQPGREGVDNSHLAHACWIMAHVALDLHQLEQASLFSQLAAKHALEAKDPSLMNLASEVRQRVAIKRSELPA